MEGGDVRQDLLLNGVQSLKTVTYTFESSFISNNSLPGHNIK